jgi:tRNA-2-methylthio-N6-dimethylallyladenosine synthase
MNKKLKVAIKTFGCQMNMYDTEVAEGVLENTGFEILRPDQGTIKISHREKIPTGADVVLLNTCSVREHAEEKVYAHLGMFGSAKQKNPDLVVGMMGCMVEEHREKLFKKFPQIDLLIGTRNIKELPGLVREVLESRRQVSKIKQDGISIEYTDQIKRRGKFHAWLPVMTGCDKVCTFCIVPITRGSEVSMPSREVYREASRLVSEGVKTITLLGQNVNSYNGSAERGSTFPELLESLCGIQGLEKIMFTTSHPQDATEELYRVISRNPKISRRFHLPLQSGSDRMLKRMKRLHTFEEYRMKIEKMRAMIPDVSVTTDIIAGFSGETEEDHSATVRALEEIRYDGAFIYKYSVRPGTPAAKLEDDVPLAVKEARNAELLSLQKRISRENGQAMIGKTVEVFVDSVSPKNPLEVRGGTNQEKVVVFPGDPGLMGQTVKVKIQEMRADTFIGISA